MKRRDIRYQAAVVEGERVLLLRVVDHASETSYWLFPGGGREPGETAEACVQREVFEETSLQVDVERLLFAGRDIPEGMYDYLHTYLCRIRAGSAKPGIEPEVDTPDQQTIQEVGWFDLRDPTSWNSAIRSDPITYPLLLRLRVSLDYLQQQSDK